MSALASRRRLRRTSRSAAARLAVCVGLAFIAGLAAAQYALDAGLGASRINRAAPTMPVAQPVFTVNRSTGEFQHNPANAFNDPIYRIHQRYTHDRFTYFDAGRNDLLRTGRTATAVSPALTGPRPQHIAPTRLPTTHPFAGPAPSRGVAHSPYSAARRAPASMSMQAPMHVRTAPMRTAPMHTGVGTLKAPTYRVAGAGRRR